MGDKKDLDKVINNLKQLVILYEEVADELINNLEEKNRLLEKAKQDIVRLCKKNEELESNNNSLLDKVKNLEEDNDEKRAKIAKLKQTKIPSIETITRLMSELQGMLMKATDQNAPQTLDEGDGENEGTEESEKHPVIDLSKDKASDEDEFNPVIM